MTAALRWITRLLLCFACSLVVLGRRNKLVQTALENNLSAIAYEGEPFVVMNWNVLADGLSSDGFVVPLVGIDPDKVPKRKYNDWDKAKAKSLDLRLSMQLKGGPVSEEMVAGSMAEFIEDQILLKNAVVDPIGKDLKTKFTDRCYDKKVQYKAVAACVQKGVRSFPVYTGHEVVDKYGEKITDGEFAPSAYYVGPTASTMSISAGDACGNVVLKASKACPTIVPPDKAIKIMKASTMQYLWAVERLNRKWGLKMHDANLDNLMDWGSSAEEEEATDYTAPALGRGAKLVSAIKAQDPDIIGLEEVDHYHFMQTQLAPTFTSTLQEATKYSYKMDCMEAASDTTFTFHPKCWSNAARFHPKKSKGQTGNDNDGSAVFWKVSRYDAVKIVKMTYNADGKFGKDGGLTCVLLKDKFAHAAGKEHYVWACATHLDSGDTEGNEEDRRMKFAAIGLISRHMRQNVNCESDACKIAFVLTMDGNTYPGFTKGKYNSKDNVNTLMEYFGAKNYAVKQADEGHYKQTAKIITASVNKIRGYGSMQPWKIGEYQLDRIDYVAFSAELEQKSFPELYRYDRTDARDRARAFNFILPSKANPSDHLPVTVSLAFKD